MQRLTLIAALMIVGLSLATTPAGSFAQTAPAASPTATSTPPATDTPTVAPTDTPTVSPATTRSPVTSSPPAPAADTTTPVAVPAPIISNVPCATDDPSSERVGRSERHGSDDDGQGDDDEFRTGNGRNQVIVHNCTDNRLRVRAAIQLNTIPGRVVKPLNLAYAEGSCASCQTLAVALQIDLYSAEHATDIEPQNFAIALNTACTGCVTVSRAVQFVQGVDEPNDVSEDISDTVDALDDELTSIQSDPTITLPEAESRLNAVLFRFAALGGTLGDQRQERDD